MTVLHPFLLEPAVWRAEGTYFDDRGGSASASGESRMIHDEPFWRLEGHMAVELADQTVRMDNRYEIAPLDEGKGATVWKSFNPGVGEIRGRFTMIDDVILSSYVSVDGEHSGEEVMIKLNEGTYLSRGCLYRKSRRLSSWAMTLTRQPR